jgi:hypothetical protein
MNSTMKSGSASEASAQEVQARFQDDAELKGAIEQLGLVGYDRSDLSLPEDQSASGLGAPNDDVNDQQLRTMGSSMAGTVAAFALAGATIATGGAAGVAALGAVAVGVGTTAAASVAGAALEDNEHRASAAQRDQQGAEGSLLLAVRTRGKAQIEQVTTILRAAGATDVHPVSQSDAALTAGVSAASWTGS